MLATLSTHQNWKPRVEGAVFNKSVEFHSLPWLYPAGAVWHCGIWCFSFFFLGNTPQKTVKRLSKFSPTKILRSEPKVVKKRCDVGQLFRSWFQIYFMFIPTRGNLTNMFQIRWNHQLFIQTNMFLSWRFCLETLERKGPLFEGWSPKIEAKQVPRYQCTTLADGGSRKTTRMSHTIHVWYIYLHLVDFYGKCR